MNYEKIEGRRRGSNIFCCDEYLYSKNNEYQNKINLRCVLHKKDCSGTAYIEFGKFFNNQKHNHLKCFGDIEKAKIEARIKNESETSTPVPKDIYKENINPENVDVSTFTKISSIMRKRRSNNFPPIPRKVEEFDNLLKTLISGQLMAIS